MQVEELSTLNIGKPFIQAWKGAGINELTEVQEAALSDSDILNGQNAVIVAPTSSGKTFIGEVLAVRVASSLHRVIYLVPYKALADEKYADFSEAYRDLGLPVVVSSGDHSEFDRDIRRGDFSIAVIVYEKLAQLLVQSPGIISDCHLVVVDETQLLGDKNRGPLLEMLLTKIKRGKPSPQILCLSATVGALNDFHLWLGAKVIEITGRPVPLWEGVFEKPGDVTFYNVAEGKTESRNIGGSVPAAGKDDLIDSAVRATEEGKQLLIFRTKVDDTERTAEKLAQVLPHQTVAAEARQRIMLLEDTPLREFLDKNIEKRIAYHNAGLSLEERRLVEDLFRQGVLRIIVTTTTLAAGVNLPVDTVIVADHKRWDTSRRTNVAIGIGEYKNCAGRAGRYGKKQAGTCLLLGEVRGQANILETQYIHGDLPKLESAIPQQPDLAKHLLGLVAERLGESKADIVSLFRESFAFRSYYVPGGFESELIEAIESGIDELISLQLVEVKDRKLTATPLGAVCARSGVSVKTFGTLETLVRLAPVDAIPAAEIFQGITDVEEMKSLRPFSREKRAGLLSRWITGEGVMDLSGDYSTSQYSIGY